MRTITGSLIVAKTPGAVYRHRGSIWRLSWTSSRGGFIVLFTAMNGAVISRSRWSLRPEGWTIHEIQIRAILAESLSRKGILTIDRKGCCATCSSMCVCVCVCEREREKKIYGSMLSNRDDRFSLVYGVTINGIEPCVWTYFACFM